MKHRFSWQWVWLCIGVHDSCDIYIYIYIYIYIICVYSFIIVYLLFNRFDYEAEEADDLSFEAGDVIKIVERIGDEWLKGEVDAKTGIFPVSYVEIIEHLPEGEQASLTPTQGNYKLWQYNWIT